MNLPDVQAQCKRDKALPPAVGKAHLDMRTHTHTHTHTHMVMANWLEKFTTASPRPSQLPQTHYYCKYECVLFYNLHTVVWGRGFRPILPWQPGNFPYHLPQLQQCMHHWTVDLLTRSIVSKLCKHSLPTSEGISSL